MGNLGAASSLGVLAPISHKVEVKLSAGAVSSEGSTGAGEAASQVAPHMSAGGGPSSSLLQQEALVLCYMTRPQGCLRVLPTWQRLPSNEKNESKGQATLSFGTRVARFSK